MQQFTAWPPPNWTEVVITWDEILADKKLKPQMLYDWCEQHTTGRYHVHGWQSTEGFAFRFENPKDATVFAIIWA